jgi:hypothetical protein
MIAAMSAAVTAFAFRLSLRRRICVSPWCGLRQGVMQCGAHVVIH